MSTYSNYVAAGVDTYVQLMGKFIDNHPGFFDDSCLSNFMSKTVNRYLFSFGTGINYKTKKLSPKHVQKFIDAVRTIRNRPFMANTKLYWDSGGFQVAQGGIQTKDMGHFCNLYYDTLAKNPNLYEFSFILDLPPGPGSGEIFQSYRQIEDLNRSSYENCIKTVPESVRKEKVIYIHHFRTPSLFNTWQKFLFEEHLADGYTNFGTGGIVANMSTDLVIPIIIYTIPLSSILLFAKTSGLQKFRFHVLGGANYADVFYHKLFSHHIKQEHDIDVEITYDSSAIFKGLIIGRYIPVFISNNNLMKMSIKSDQMNLRFHDKTVEDKCYEVLKELSDEFGFKELGLPEVQIYEDSTQRFHPAAHMYFICHLLRIYKKLEVVSQAVVEDIYPYYKNGDHRTFVEECWKFVSSLNQGKKTRKVTAKAGTLFKSLDVLSNLDMDYNKYVIDKFMSKDDISGLHGSGRSPSWDSIEA